MEQVKILIVEDELIIAEDMKSMLLQKYIVTGIAINYEEALESLAKRQPDIVMLDINLLGKQNGIDLAHHINKNYRIPFIFVTSLGDEHTLEQAKATHPHAYLIKPFEKRNLLSAIEIALSNANAAAQNLRQTKPDSQKQTMALQEVFFVKKDQYYVKLNVSDIDYIVADGNYLDILSKGEKFIIRSTLKGFLDQLNPEKFLQVHKSYIINLSKVSAIASDHVLIHQDKIPLSATGRSELDVLIQKLS